MKRFVIFFLFLTTFCISAYSQASGLVDLKFGRYQIADSQWNVSACMYTITCQIYSKNPGTAYKIPWTSGQLSWATGDYVAFLKTGNATNPWNAVQYNSSGVQKAVMGTGHIINMGNDFFFFVGNDNNTGQLFSMTQGFSNTSGLTWTGTLNPTVTQVDTYAANGSTTPLSAGQTYTAAPTAPTLCCGGSSASFSADTTNVAKVQAFINRTTADSQVHIEQIGNSNTVLVEQTGSNNNYAEYNGNGSYNNISIKQNATNSSQKNYVELNVTGNSNTVDIKQRTSNEVTAFTKSVFANVNGDNNSLIIDQKNSGSHYASVTLNGGNKSVNITQQGSANHMADITLSGTQSSGINLTQQGATQQFYSINHTCSTAGGCGTISVTQGQ